MEKNIFLFPTRKISCLIINDTHPQKKSLNKPQKFNAIYLFLCVIIVRDNTI